MYGAPLIRAYIRFKVAKREVIWYEASAQLPGTQVGIIPQRLRLGARFAQTVSTL